MNKTRTMQDRNSSIEKEKGQLYKQLSEHDRSMGYSSVLQGDGVRTLTLEYT